MAIMEQRVPRRLGVTLTTAVLVAALAAPGAGAWTGPFEVPRAVVASTAEVVVAPDGTTTAAWLRYDPSAGQTRVEAAVRPPGGAFGAPELLAIEPAALRLRAAVDAAGTVTVAWIQREAGTDVVRSTSRPGGGPFGPVRDVSDTGSSSRDAQLAAAGTTAVLTWVQAGRVRAAIAAGGEPFVVQKPLTPLGRSGELPQVAVAPTGAAVVAWTYETAAGTFWVRAAARPPGGDFAALADVRQSTRTIDDLEVALSAGGRATLTWKRSLDSSELPRAIESAARGVTGNFGPPGEIPGATSYVDSDYALAVSADDTAVVVVVADGGVHAAFRPSGSAFDPMKPVAQPSGWAPRARFLDGELVAIGWHHLGGEYAVVLGADRAPGPVASLAAPGASVATTQHGIASDDDGTLVDWWLRDGTGGGSPTYRIGLSVLDAAAPALAAVSVPADGIAGRALEMRATGRDRWSGSTTTWRFGDGATEEGEAVAHAYAHPGDYTVAITVTDAAGNTSSATRTVRVRGRQGGPATPLPTP